MKLQFNRDDRSIALTIGKEPEVNRSEMTRDVLAEIQSIFDAYVVFPSEEARDATVLWTLHTHVADVFESTPRLAVLSNEPSSGKTRVLELLEELVPNPMKATNIHPAVLYRTIDQSARATLLLDEVDCVFGRNGSATAHQQLRSVINAGYRQGAVVRRCVGNDGVKDFDAFAPVALAGLGDLPETIMTRSIVIRMRKRRGSEEIRPFRLRYARTQMQCAKMSLEEWSMAVEKELAMSFPEMPLRDRAADIWESLFAIAALAGGPYPERCRKAAIELTRKEGDKASASDDLLRDLYQVFDGEAKVPTVELLTRLYDLGRWTPENLDPRALSRVLSEYGVGPTTIRNGEVVGKGYKASDLEILWGRLGLLTNEDEEIMSLPKIM